MSSSNDRDNLDIVDTGSSLAPSDTFTSHGRKAIDLLEQISGGHRVFWTGLPTESHAHRLDIFRRMSSKENEIEDIMFPNYFDVTNVIIGTAQFTDAKGEQVVTPKIVLIDQNGNSKSLLAKVWITEFIELFMAFGLPPWETPIRVSAKSAKGNGANRYYTLFLP